MVDVTGDDNFAAAFERLSSLGEGSKPEEVAAIIADPVVEGGETPPADPPAPAAGEPGEPTSAPADGAGEPDASAPPAEGQGDTPPEPAAPVAEQPKGESDDALLARLAALVKTTPEPAAPAPAAPAVEAPPVFTEEEQSFLSTYDKDWPDISKGEALKRRAEYRELVGYVFNEFAKEIAPLLETVQTLAQRTHISDLRATVTDYEDVRDKVVEWAGNQPDYLRAAYQQVIQQGSVDEISDLIERYRKDTGTVFAPAAPAAPKAEPTSKAARAAAALAPIPAKRSASPTAVEPDDFESAFAAFAEKLPGVR